MTSIDKIRESIDEVVAQVMLAHADQLRNQVSDRIRVFLDEDAQRLQAIEQQLGERSEQAKSLEQQLGQTRTEISEKQKHIETIENQLRELQEQWAKANGRVGELENTLKSETERLAKHNHELEQLLELSQEEVKQLQKTEEHQRNRLQGLEKEIEEIRADHKKALKERDREFADKAAEFEQRLENSSKVKAEALEAKEKEHSAKLNEVQQQIDALRREHSNEVQEFEGRLQNLQNTHNEALQSKDQELKSRVKEIEEMLELAQKEAHAKLEGKERELLEQVHLLEELLVQGQHAREQQLEAKDKELHEALEKHKAEHGAKIDELSAQLADREKMFHSQGGELQERILKLEKELGEGQKQLADVRSELKDSQSAFEQAQKQVDELTASSRKREEEHRHELETRQSEWHKREHELSGKHAELETKHGSLASQKSELEGMQSLWEQREKELTAQLSDYEKKLAEFAATEQAWQKREQELLGHRDQVLNSSAEASVASAKALESSIEDQTRLQTQLDALLEELGKVREELQQTQEAHFIREKQLNEELASLRNELAGKSASTANVVVAGATSEPEPVVDESAVISAALEHIRQAHTQTDTLKALLEGVAGLAGRSGILVVQGRNATGWAARGFGSDAEFRKVSVECTRGLASKVVHSHLFIRGQMSEFDQKMVDQFGGSRDGHAYVFPLMIRDRVAALLYADCGNHVVRNVSADSIEAVVKATGVWLDELAQAKPAPAKPVAIPAPRAAAAAAAAVAAPETARVAAPVITEAPAGDNLDASRQKARRFAKLLVDEIKLYNKDAVEQGRRNNDLYDRLRESIDKSRASYEKRWGKTITDVDYFREELVRNLAENNAAVLGSNFR